MGYDLHITRRAQWSDEGADIAAAEWLAYVARDAELRLATVNGPYFAIWSGPCEYEEAWFDWSCGNISTKNPDLAIIRKMVAIARALNARVVGDEGEEYGEDGKAVHAAFPPASAPAPAPAPLSALRLAAGAVAVVLALAGIYLRYFGQVAWAQSAALAALVAAVFIFWLVDPERGKRKTLL